MGFPMLALLDEDACHRKLVALLHPGGLACPRCGARDGLAVHRRHRDPVADYQCGGCGRVFNAFAGAPLRARAAALRRVAAGPARRLPGGADRPPGPRAGPRPQAPARAAPPHPGPGRAGGRAAAAPGRRRGRGRRDVPERGGKKASRTPTPTTRRAAGPTSGGGTATGITTARRWPGSSAGSRAGSTWRWSRRLRGRAWSGSPRTTPRRPARSTPPSGRPTTGCRSWAGATRRCATRPGGGSGPETTTATGCARSITTRWGGSGRG